MANIVGMTLADGRALARQLQSSAGSIEQVLRHLETRVSQTAWAGTDRQRFESELRGSHATAIRSAANALRAGATEVVRAAEAQDRASRR